MLFWAKFLNFHIQSLNHKEWKSVQYLIQWLKSQCVGSVVECLIQDQGITSLNIFVISVLFLLCFHARLFIDALWSPAGKG